MRRHLLLTFLLCVAASALPFATGCGGGDNGSSAKDEAAIRSTIGTFLDGFQKADAARVCAVMTPAFRDKTTRQLGELKPTLKGKPCEQTLIVFYRHVPLDQQPPAAEEAGHWNYRGIDVQGQRASVLFSDGVHWTLIKAGGRWLISDMPILPPGNRSSPS